MTKIHEPAYPVLPAELEDAELRTVYTPRAAEIRFVFGQFRQAPTRVLILAQLKLLQRLGYMPVISDVPPAIIEHVCAVLGVRPLPRTTLARYDRSGSKSRHQKSLREFVRILPVDSTAHAWLVDIAAHAARTKAELPNIVNVVLKELVRQRYELPPVATLTRITGHARSQLHESIYRAFVDSLDDNLTASCRRAVSDPARPNTVERTQAGTETTRTTGDCILDILTETERWLDLHRLFGLRWSTRDVAEPVG
nr:DUF4158 domain-containing protein [Burkholderia pyrrocinia]